MFIIKKSDTFAVKLYYANTGKYDNQAWSNLGVAKAAMHYYGFDAELNKNIYYCIHTYSGQIYYYSVVYGALEYIRERLDYTNYISALDLIERENIKEFIDPNDCC